MKCGIYAWGLPGGGGSEPFLPLPRPNPCHLPLTGPFSSSDDRASVLFSLKGQTGTDTGRDLAYCCVGRAEAGGTE